MRALPLLELRQEYHEAKLLGAFEEEILSGSTRSTPAYWYTLDYQRQQLPERILAQLGIKL
jgi:hypothetical protein